MEKLVQLVIYAHCSLSAVARNAVVNTNKCSPAFLNEFSRTDANVFEFVPGSLIPEPKLVENTFM